MACSCSWTLVTLTSCCKSSVKDVELSYKVALSHHEQRLDWSDFIVSLLLLAFWRFYQSTRPLWFFRLQNEIWFAFVNLKKLIIRLATKNSFCLGTFKLDMFMNINVKTGMFTVMMTMSWRNDSQHIVLVSFLGYKKIQVLQHFSLSCCLTYITRHSQPKACPFIHPGL